jgi:hypothetical protein
MAQHTGKMNQATGRISKSRAIPIAKLKGTISEISAISSASISHLAILGQGADGPEDIALNAIKKLSVLAAQVL